MFHVLYLLGHIIVKNVICLLDLLVHLKAIQKKVHGRELTINFDVESESCSDSEEDKWIAIQCQKCYTLLMSEASLKNHNRFHEHYDRKPETNVEIQQKNQKFEPSDFSGLFEEPVK